MGIRRGARDLMQRGATAIDAYMRRFGEIRTGDPLAGDFASFGDRSRIEAPRLGLLNPGGVAIGDDVHIRAHSCIEAYAYPGTVVVRFHNDIHVGYNVRFVAFNGIEIGDLVGIGHGTTIADSIHNWKVAPDDAALWQTPSVAGRPLKVGRRAWIGNNCVITGGVTIGESAIIGPNAVISRDVPPFSIVTGNPARVERRRLPNGEWERLPEPVPLSEYVVNDHAPDRDDRSPAVPIRDA